MHFWHPRREWKDLCVWVLIDFTWTAGSDYFVCLWVACRFPSFWVSREWWLYRVCQILGNCQIWAFKKVVDHTLAMLGKILSGFFVYTPTLTGIFRFTKYRLWLFLFDFTRRMTLCRPTAKIYNILTSQSGICDRSVWEKMCCCASWKNL